MNTNISYEHKYKMARSWTAVLILMLLASSNFSAQAASTFGFNYWPANYSCDVLTTANWTTANQNVVKADLDHMSSLSANVLRLMFWPTESGYLLEDGGGPGGATFTSDFTEEQSNLLTLLSYCSARGIKVIIVFGNNYFNSVNPNTGNRWWMEFYTNTTDGFTNFLLDTQYWVNGFVNTIQGSAYASTVLYYDYQNGFSQDDPYAGWYINFLYDWSAIPSGKRGCSVALVDVTAPYSDDVQYLKDHLGTLRPLNFVDYHSYPANSHNADVEGCYDSVKARFGPPATVLLGEYGRESADGEANQQMTVLDVCTRARNKNIPYNLHWMFLDNAIFPNTWGLGYTTHSPKDVMGGMSSLNNKIYNPDAEIVSGGRPANWNAGSTGTITFTSGGPNASAAAANNYYARIQCNNLNTAVWMNAPSFTVSGGPMLYVNCFFRSNMASIKLGVTEYNSNWGVLAQTYGATYTPSGWSWNSYLGRVGSWSKQLNASTYYVIVSVLATSTAATPAYLDVDVFSAHTR